MPGAAVVARSSSPLLSRSAAAKLNLITAPDTERRGRADPQILPRALRLRGALALNLLDMIGVGPFLTLPLILAAMGGPQAMLGWILGALLALCDGLVWAELGAAMPAAGGSYHFLQRMYPGRLGRYLSFLFLSQLLVSAPLSVASGAIGLGQYATFLSPRLAEPLLRRTLLVPTLGPVRFEVGPVNAIAVLAVVSAIALLFRCIERIERLSLLLSSLVLLTLTWVIATGLLSPAAHPRQAFALPTGAWQPGPAFLSGLASAMLLATYDYWGYYNVTFLGAEVREPGRTIPRAILLSIAICAVLYLLLNFSVLSVLPWQELVVAKDKEAQRAVIGTVMNRAYQPLLGDARARIVGELAAGLVMLAAFGSVFSLLLGYSRIPFAAAREGSFPEPFGRLHPTRGLPHVSLLTLGAAAVLFCFFSLQAVIAALVVVRILLQFVLQHLGVMVLRRREPDLARPFRLWWYPLPPLVALAGFAYILFARTHSVRQLLLAALVAALATPFFLRLERRRGRSAAAGPDESALHGITGGP